METDVAKVLESSGAATFGSYHLEEVKAGLGKANAALIPFVVKKVVDEGLTTRQARDAAEIIASASVDGPAAVKRLLKLPYTEMVRSAHLPPDIPDDASSGKKSKTVGKGKGIDWLKNPDVVECEEWLHTAKAMIVTMRKTKGDEVGKKNVLKIWRALLVSMLGEIDRIIGGKKDV